MKLSLTRLLSRTKIDEMGTPSPEETKRNKRLLKDYYEGKLNTVRLVAKYQISSARIYQIVKRDKEAKNTA